jgi:hypothetical protein
MFITQDQSVYTTLREAVRQSPCAGLRLLQLFDLRDLYRTSRGRKLPRERTEEAVMEKVVNLYDYRKKD